MIASRALWLVLPLLPLLATLPSWAAEPPQREQVETIVREYLRAHPEVVVEALREMERREREAEGQRRAAAIRAHAAELFQPRHSPVGGNAAGDVTIVEFLDYQCDYCKRGAAEIAKLLQADPGVRLVFKEWPILGPESVLAARAALAAVQQGRYHALHAALMARSERLTEESILAAAAGVGLDLERLKRDMEAPAVREELQRTAALAQALGIRGTPALILGNQLHAGIADLATLQRLVREARREGSRP
jgi:protein-disulfide isomerase